MRHNKLTVAISGKIIMIMVPRQSPKFTKNLVLFDLFLSFHICRLGTNLLVVLHEGGKVLTGLAGRIDKSLKRVTVSQTDQLDAAIAAVEALR